MRFHNSTDNTRSNTEKLQKVLARSGIASRRASELLIASGQVIVNQLPATIGQRVDITKDLIVISGQPLALAPVKRYFLVNKPVGVICTTSDELNRPTITNLLPQKLRTEIGRLYPVGRLDKDSQGLVLLTNDGTLTQHMTHPKFNMKKTYQVQLDRLPTSKALRRLEQGVQLNDGLTTVDSYQQLVGQSFAEDIWFELVVHEGRNRLIRRLWLRLGYTVQKLIRTQLGPFSLAQLENKRWLEVSQPAISNT